MLLFRHLFCSNLFNFVYYLKVCVHFQAPLCSSESHICEDRVAALKAARVSWRELSDG